jgi:uncharacterized protein
VAAELWNSVHPAAASVLAYPEGRAALAAARRGGRLTKVRHARALGDFEGLYRELTSIGVDDDLVHQAGQLAEELDLRGYDAVHLATAMELGDDVVLVTWDADLQRATERAGLAVAGATR